MSLPFSVCTYNLGARADDYYQLCKYLQPDLAFKSAEEEKAFRARYAATQETTTLLLRDHAEVYCLQEVGDTKRPMITALQWLGFEVVYLRGDRAFDTAIALDTRRFKDITNHSIDVRINGRFKKDAAIATAIDIESNQRIAFVSAHAPGFDFTKANVDPEEAAEGDLYCQKIADKLSQVGDCAIQVIGADMNDNPEKWNARFQIFSNRGFQVLRTGSSTNVNPKDAVHQEREIDFIFTKTHPSIFQRIAAIFFSTLQYSAAIYPIQPLRWDATVNASDHLPVFATISSQVADSLIYQFLLSIYRYCVPEQPRPVVSS